MAFKLSTELVFPWPVKVREPDQDNPGKLVEHTFTGVFAIIEPEKAKARDDERRLIVDRFMADAENKDSKSLAEELTDHDLKAVKEVFRGWRDDLLGPDDKPWPATEANIEYAFSIERIKAAVIRAYREAISEDQARLGN